MFPKKATEIPKYFGGGCGTQLDISGDQTQRMGWRAVLGKLISKFLD